MGTCTDPHVIIPRVSPDGDTVTGIMGEAFAYTDILKSLTIPNTVTAVSFCMDYLSPYVQVSFLGTRAEWYALTRSMEYDRYPYPRYVACADGVVFMCGSTVEDMGYEFTSNGDGTCYVSGIGTAVTGVIPRYSPAGDVVTAIGDGALQGQSFYVVGIPDTVTHIGEGAFKETSLEYMIISDSVTYIGDRAFSNTGYNWSTQAVCNAISKLTNLTYLGKYALSMGSNPGGVSLTLPDGIIGIEDGLLSGGYYSDMSLTIPKSVTYIGSDILSGWRVNATVTYRGTVAEWRAIEKHADWNREMYPITITCTDGQVVTEDRHTPLD
jgi:hypothetical protein